jgi:hypothetical protein
LEPVTAVTAPSQTTVAGSSDGPERRRSGRKKVAFGHKNISEFEYRTPAYMKNCRQQVHHVFGL